MLVYLKEFFLFAFLGWMVDSLYSSISKKKFISSGYFRGVPLCPIYGFGGILLLNSFFSFKHLSAWQVVIITTILIILLEYVGGWLTEHLLDERLWDYSGEWLNIHGYISAWHGFLWLMTTSILYRLFIRQEDAFLMFLKPKTQLTQSQEVVFCFFVLIVGLGLTSYNKKIRLTKLAQKRLAKALSVEEFFDFEKWQKLAKEKQKELLNSWDSSDFVKKIKEHL